MSNAPDPRDQIDRTNLSVWLKSETGVDIPEADLEILARCPILWSGWEADHTVLLYRIRSTGRTDLWVVNGGHIEDQSGGIVGTLQERLAAYRDAIARTELFLRRVGGMMPPVRTGFVDLARSRIAARLRLRGHDVVEDDIEIVNWVAWIAPGGIEFRLRSTGETGLHSIQPGRDEDDWYRRMTLSETRHPEEP